MFPMLLCAIWCQPINSSFVDHRWVWSAGRNQRYVTLSGCRHSHTFQCVSDLICFDTWCLETVQKWPLASRKMKTRNTTLNISGLQVSKYVKKNDYSVKNAQALQRIRENDDFRRFLKTVSDGADVTFCTQPLSLYGIMKSELIMFTHHQEKGVMCPLT